jgi:hypothetical protein
MARRSRDGAPKTEPADDQQADEVRIDWQAEREREREERERIAADWGEWHRTAMRARLEAAWAAHRAAGRRPWYAVVTGPGLGSRHLLCGERTEARMRRELGRQAYEVLSVEPWKGPLPDPVTGRVSKEVESRMRTEAADLVRQPPPIKMRGPKSWAMPARRQEAVEGGNLEEAAVVDAHIADADGHLGAGDEVYRQPGADGEGLVR